MLKPNLKNATLINVYISGLTISTAHKAKGQEWQNVVVIDDFTVVQKTQDGKEIVDDSELSLLYVALTRARWLVQIPESLAKYFGIQQDFQQLRLAPMPQTRPSPPVRQSRPQYTKPPPARPQPLQLQNVKPELRSPYAKSSLRERARATPTPKDSAFKRFIAKLFGK